MPLTLIHSTIRIARGFVAGNTIAILAQGVLNSMMLNQLRLATVVICLGLGASYSAWQALGAAENGKGRGQDQAQPGEKNPTVRLTRPAVRDIVRVVGQPVFIESYQRTPIFARVTGYVEKSFVDIGDKVKKGDVLATMFVPEPVEKPGGAQGRVKVDEDGRELARKTLPAAEAQVRSAQSARGRHSHPAWKPERPRPVGRRAETAQANSRPPGRPHVGRSVQGKRRGATPR